MKRAVTLSMALLLSGALYLTVPAESATPAPMPPSGAILVVAAVSDGMTWQPIPGAIAIPPVCP